MGPRKEDRPAKDPWQRAVDALSRRALSIAEVREKLRKAGHGPAEIDEVVARLTRLSLVDDRTVAYNHAHHRAREGRRGPRRVRAELLRRGLDSGLVDEALEDAFPPDREDEAFAAAVRKLAGRGGIPEEREDRMKLARKLARAGFAPFQVTRLLDGDLTSALAGEDIEDE